MFKAQATQQPDNEIVKETKDLISETNGLKTGCMTSM